MAEAVRAIEKRGRWARGSRILRARVIHRTHSRNVCIDRRLNRIVADYPKYNAAQLALAENMDHITLTLECEESFSEMTFFQRLFGIAIGFIFIGIAVAKIATRNDLPGCDTKPTRDALSNIFKQTKVDVKRFDEIKTNATQRTLITCTALLTLDDDHKAEIDYSIAASENGQFLVKTTDVRNK